MIPMVRVLREARLLAWKLGSYPSSFMALRTFCLVSSLMEGLFLQVRETVEADTPAQRSYIFDGYGHRCCFLSVFVMCFVMPSALWSVILL